MTLAVHFRLHGRTANRFVLLEPRTPEGREAISRWREAERTRLRVANPSAHGPFVDAVTGVLTLPSEDFDRFAKEFQS